MRTDGDVASVDPTAVSGRRRRSAWPALPEHGGLTAGRVVLIVALVAAGLAVRWVLLPLLGSHAAYLTVYPVIVLSAVLWGRLPGALAGALGQLSADVLFVAPTLHLHLTAATWISFVVVVGSAWFLGGAGDGWRASRRALKRTNEQLVASQVRFRFVSQATHDVIWDWDLATDALDCNEALETTFGYRHAQAGRSSSWWSDRIHPEDRPRVAASIRAVVDDPGQSAWSAEYRFRHADGTWRDVLDRGLVARDASRRAVRMIGSMLDITERVRTERALQEANARLVVVDQRRSAFLAMLSHELRNPLAPIRNGLHVLERATPGGQQARRATEVIGRQVAHLTRLVDDLLDVTRISRGKIRLQRRRVELCKLLHRTAEDHRSIFAAAGVDLELHVCDAPVWVDGDPIRIAQVIGNLLANAAKFTARDGHVHVALTRAPDHAEIRVRDDGAGIPAELLPRLFEPFVQAEATLDRSKGGLGLGLALVKGILELHGGEVTARSGGPGRGSEFTVRLLVEPAVPPPATQLLAGTRE